jgi:hypothetical protein
MGMKPYIEHITHAELLRLLHYDPESGIFTRKEQRGREQAGSVAGGLSAYGYHSMVIDYRRYKNHRLAWFYVHGRWPQGDIDHINGDRSDNRIANLREVSRSVNLQNQRKANQRNKSGFLGVALMSARKLSRRPYVATIKANGKLLHLGRFATAEEAHSAYLSKKRELHEGCTI